MLLGRFVDRSKQEEDKAVVGGEKVEWGSLGGANSFSKRPRERKRLTYRRAIRQGVG